MSFLLRIFRKGSSFRGSQTSLSDHEDTKRQARSAKSTSSLDCLSSYNITQRDLEKNKIHKAAWEGNLRKLQQLARPGQISVRDHQGRTPLHLAVVKGHVEIVKFLIEEDARLDFCDQDGRTPLIKAVLSGNKNRKVNYEICDMLIKGGGDKSINAVDKDGNNALHYAVRFGNENLVELFLKSSNCDPNYKDREQMTPLHLAVKGNHGKIIEILLTNENGQHADRNTVNQLGQTPLHLAASAGYVKIVQLLLSRNDQEPCDPTVRDSNQTTALEMAKASYHDSCAKLIEQYEEQWLKDTPRRVLSSSINDTSMKLTTSISMQPKANRDRTRSQEDTTDDSSSLSNSKPSLSVTRRAQRPSDQWSDDVKVPGVASTTALPGTTSTESKQILPADEQNLTTNHVVKSSPQRQPPPSKFSIQPAFDRKDSDNTTSQSLSSEKVSKPSQPVVQKPKIETNSHVNTFPQPMTSTKSWSDDTITAPVIPKKVSEVRTNTWDSSITDDDTYVPKAKHPITVLQKTLPFSTEQDDSAESDDENNSVETKIQKYGPTITQKPANANIANGYKIVSVTKIQSPASEDSSWTPTSAKISKDAPSKGIENLVFKPKPDESTWDDSQTLTKESKHTSANAIENLVKIVNTIANMKPNPIPSSNIVGKLITTSMVERADSIQSENTLHEFDHDDDDYENTASVTTPRKTLNTNKLPMSTQPYDINHLYGSPVSPKSTLNDIQLNELRENIRKLERNQEDTQELKQQLKEMEKEKNNFEKLYKQNDQMLRQIENQLEQEKHEKQRLELLTKSLNNDLSNVKQKLQSLENEKDLLSQRCNKLKEERDSHDEKLRLFQANSLSAATKSSHNDEDIDKIQCRHREELRLLSAENDELHNRTKQLESDLELHKESLDVTVRYKIDLERAMEERTFYQRELDRLKNEKQSIEHEKLEYKTKYDSLQDEIRVILLDRSKLEQKLTSELQEHMEEKLRSTDDLQKYRMQIEQLNIKLGDAEARLLILQTQNEALLTSKDREIKNEFESLSQRLSQIELNKSDAEQRYRNQHNDIANRQLRTSHDLPTSSVTTNPTQQQQQQQQQTNSSQCNICHTLQRNYEQEREQRLKMEKDNERLRNDVIQQQPHPLFNPLFSGQSTNENYLIENSKKIRSDTERVKTELSRLREDFDKLVSNYEPQSSFQHKLQLHSQIQLFRQFYEYEFQQRQLLMSNLTSGIKHHKSLSRLSPMYQSFQDPYCTTCTSSRLLKERLETAIDTTLADQRLHKIKHMPNLPRHASSLLTLNKGIDLLHERYYV